MSLDRQRSLANRIREQFLEEQGVEDVTSFSFEVDEINSPSLLKLTIKIIVQGYGELETDFILEG